MKKLICIILTLPFVCYSQEKQGIRFVEDLSWQQILEKAKADNKYIFVDCYTTWCGPCKKMDKETYTSEKVGAFMNERFISVKVQMDTSKKDNDKVKMWYQVARDLQREYNISAFPSFLFFSKDGKIIHRAQAYLQPDSLIAIASNAMDTGQQYYTLLEKFRKGGGDNNMVKKLIYSAHAFRDYKLANSIGQDYLHKYLYKINEEELYTKENIRLVSEFIKSSKEKGFNIFYKNGKKVDKIMEEKGYSQQVVCNIITQEEIKPIVLKAVNEKCVPDWVRLTNNIKKKFKLEFAALAVINAKISWYIGKKDWPQVINYTFQKFDKYGLDTAGNGKVAINNFAWNLIFMHSDNPAHLNKAIGWMELVCKGTSINDRLYRAYIDTYANLLYKAGRKDEAIRMEEIALNSAIERNLVPQIKGYNSILAKMKNGEPTWPVK